MKSKVTRMLCVLAGLALCMALHPGAASAQQPTPSPQKSADAKTQSPAPSRKEEEDADYTVTSSLEIGYRGLRVDGDINKYQSDLNYKAGPRIGLTSSTETARPATSRFTGRTPVRSS